MKKDRINPANVNSSTLELIKIINLCILCGADLNAKIDKHGNAYQACGACGTKIFVKTLVAERGWILDHGDWEGDVNRRKRTDYIRYGP